MTSSVAHNAKFQVQVQINTASASGIDVAQEAIGRATIDVAQEATITEVMKGTIAIDRDPEYKLPNGRMYHLF